MTFSLLTADTKRSLGQPDSDGGLRQPVFMIVPTPKSLEEAARGAPDDVAWLAQNLANWVGANAAQVKEGHALLEVSSVDGRDGGLLLDGRDGFALHGLLQFPLWRQAILFQGGDDGSALAGQLHEHLAVLHGAVRRALGFFNNERLPSAEGLVVPEELDDFEAIVIDGAGDGLFINGLALREPFRTIGIELADPPSRQDLASSWLPLGLNEHTDSPVIESLPCPDGGYPEDKDSPAPAHTPSR